MRMLNFGRCPFKKSMMVPNFTFDFPDPQNRYDRYNRTRDIRRQWHFKKNG